MPEQSDKNLAFDFGDFFEESLSGFVVSDNVGNILRANRRFASWLGCRAEDLVGQRFASTLTIGGKIYFETHLGPLLQMQGHFDEIALELRSSDGERIPVLVNAINRRDDLGATLFTRWTIFKAADRRRYEDNLRQASAAALKALSDEKEVSVLREQFIAVLGHDLRSPLGGMVAALSLLNSMASDAKSKAIIAMANDSASRMANLVADVMDFARGRLGGGMTIDRQLTDITPHLRQVVAEQATAHPDRMISSHLNVAERIECDVTRISQLLSNLLANAITHGAKDGPVTVEAQIRDNRFELSVRNHGAPIPAETLPHLFEPFKREEARPSQNGLGLGLYIASEIARAHGGTLSATSNETETKFKFEMPYRIMLPETD